jgi:glucose/arabinose dehydrogenase
VLRAEQADPRTRKFLGLALHPEWATNRVAYLYVNYGPDGARRNKILRLRERDGVFAVDDVVFDGIPSDGNHDGGRLAFGPDGHLYATTGDVTILSCRRTSRASTARSCASPRRAMKRLWNRRPGTRSSTPAATPASCTPMGTGTRRGLAWDRAGVLYASEHGPTGERYDPVRFPGGAGRQSRDEINRIEPGANYGWPVISGDMTARACRRRSPRAATAPPGRPATWPSAPTGHLYMPALRGTICAS